MNKPTILRLNSRYACFALFFFAWQLGLPAEEAGVDRLVEGRLIKATSAVLAESGVCLEGRREFSSMSLKVRIPIKNSVGKATDFYMRVRQGLGGRHTTASMLLSEFEGKWAPPVYVTLWDLSHPANEVSMLVGFVNQETGVTTKITFDNTDLKNLFGFEEGDEGESDFDTVLRVGCRRWDLENAKDKVPWDLSEILCESRFALINR